MGYGQIALGEENFSCRKTLGVGGFLIRLKQGLVGQIALLGRGGELLMQKDGGRRVPLFA